MKVVVFQQKEYTVRVDSLIEKKRYSDYSSQKKNCGSDLLGIQKEEVSPS